MSKEILKQISDLSDRAETLIHQSQLTEAEALLQQAYNLAVAHPLNDTNICIGDPN